MRRLMLIVMLLGAMSAHAAPENARRAPDARGGAASAQLSADQAAAIAQQATGGRVLSAHLVTRREGTALYRIKVLTPDGVVRVLLIDARTGALR